jgi:hypothetical protein
MMTSGSKQRYESCEHKLIISGGEVIGQARKRCYRAANNVMSLVSLEIIISVGKVIGQAKKR